MNSTKATVRTYFKYSYSTFTQPVLNKYGDFGGSSFSVQSNSEVGVGYAWCMFDGLNQAAAVWVGLLSATPYVTFYNPVPLKVTKLTIANSASYAVKGGNVKGSNDNSNWTTIKTFTNANVTANATWDIDMSSNTASYKYYRITCTSSNGGTYAYIGECTITAQQRNVVAGTSSSYDYYEDLPTYYYTKSGTTYYCTK